MLSIFSIHVNGLDELYGVIKKRDVNLTVKMIKFVSVLLIEFQNFPEQNIQQQRESENPPAYGVFTVEHGRRTLINYHSDMPPRSPVDFVIKDMPPTYEDALKLHELQTAENSTTNTTVATLPITQRRTSI